MNSTRFNGESIETTDARMNMPWNPALFTSGVNVSIGMAAISLRLAGSATRTDNENFIE
jgi:hypothetical protein